VFYHIKFISYLTCHSSQISPFIPIPPLLIFSSSHPFPLCSLITDRPSWENYELELPRPKTYFDEFVSWKWNGTSGNLCVYRTVADFLKTMGANFNHRNGLSGGGAPRRTSLDSNFSHRCKVNSKLMSPLYTGRAPATNTFYVSV